MGAAAARSASLPVLHITDAALHLQTGRLILQTGAIPTADPFTFTQGGQTWVVQQWLPALVFGLIERVGGYLALSVLVSVLVGALTGVLAWRALRVTPTFWSVFLTVLAVFAGAGNWTLRGNLFSFLLLIVTYELARGRAPAPWFGLLFALWANVHGLFLLGLGLLVVLAVGDVLEAGSRRGRLRYWLTTIAVAGLGSLATPWGWDLYDYALSVGTLARGTISEWAPPTLARWDARFFAALVAVAVPAVVRSRVEGRLTDLLLIIAFASAGALAVRNLSGGAIVIALAAARHPWRTPGPERTPIGSRPWRPVDRVLAGTLVTASVATTTTLLAVVGPFSQRYPVRSMETTAASRLWTEESWGTTAILVGWPRYLVNIDARVSLHGGQGYEEHRLVRDAKPGWDAWLDDHCVDGVLVSGSAPLAGAVDSAPGWRMALREDISGGEAVLYERQPPAQCRVSTSPSR